MAPLWDQLLVGRVIGILAVMAPPTMAHVQLLANLELQYLVSISSL